MTTLTHLNWRPVILLKIVRLPFGTLGGLSLKRCYLALEGQRLLYADWTLEADERAESLVCAAGWLLPTLPDMPTQLKGAGAKLIPSGALQRQPVRDIQCCQHLAHAPDQAHRNSPD